MGDFGSCVFYIAGSNIVSVDRQEENASFPVAVITTI
jgi:hypothetical protein